MSVTELPLSADQRAMARRRLNEAHLDITDDVLRRLWMAFTAAQATEDADTLDEARAVVQRYRAEHA